jgi:lipopolysaccharide transport system permease protein
MVLVEEEKAHEGARRDTNKREQRRGGCGDFYCIIRAPSCPFVGNPHLDPASDRQYKDQADLRFIMVLSLVQYRSFIWRHAWADLRHRYAGTGMGVAWNVVHPLAVIAIYSIVFTQIFKSPMQGAGKLPYTFYLCSGFFPWLAFSDCVSRGCRAFLANANYLKKLPIPEQVFVAQNAAASTLSLAINFSLLLLIAIGLGWTPGWTWLLLPVPMILLQGLGFGLGLLLGTLNVFFRDIAEWVNIALQVLVWTVPIIYRIEILPAGVARALAWHPLMPAVQAIHDLFLNRQLPPAWVWFPMVAWPVGMSILGFLVLRKLRPEIRDVI